MLSIWHQVTITGGGRRIRGPGEGEGKREGIKWGWAYRVSRGRGGVALSEGVIGGGRIVKGEM